MLSVTTSASSASFASVRSSISSLIPKANIESLGFGGVLTAQLSNLFNAGVKALLPSTKELYVTRIVDAIMEMKADSHLSVENYLYFDPKVQKKARQGSIPRKKEPFKEAIVFVVGGGNYVEYQNLQEYAKKQPVKKIIYGSTQILTATQFLEQVAQLSKKMS